VTIKDATKRNHPTNSLMGGMKSIELRTSEDIHFGFSYCYLNGLSNVLYIHIYIYI